MVVVWFLCMHAYLSSKISPSMISAEHDAISCLLPWMFLSLIEPVIQIRQVLPVEFTVLTFDDIFQQLHGDRQLYFWISSNLAGI